MAFLPSASAVRTMAVRFIMDNTDLITGTGQAEAELQGLSVAADNVSADMGASFDAAGNRIGGVIGPGGVINQDLEAGGATAKGQATQIGAEVAQNIAQGVETGDYSGALSNGLSQIGQAAALAGNVAAAGALIGGGIAAAILGAIIKNIEAGEAEFAAAITTLTDAAQKVYKEEFGIDLVPTWLNPKQIRATTVAAIDLEETFAKIGGTETQGLAKIKDLSDDTGIAWQEVADLLKGVVGKRVHDTREALKEVVGETENVYKAGQKVGEVETEQSKLAREILDLIKQQRAEVRGSLQYQKDLQDYAYGIEGAWTRSAEALERSAQATQTMHDNWYNLTGIPDLLAVRGRK